ncbi:MAG TPA: hypothetical protein VN776_08435 [Terracidiphilus sp.]|nr:hypothetical protein [Terracidiphilus sp.]
MREALEGRVMWEKTDHGICLTVPVRRWPFTSVYAPLVTIWLILATIRYWRLLSGPHPEDIDFVLQMISIGIYVVGFIYFVGWLIWNRTGETVVTLNPAEVRIQTRVFGVDLSSRTFQTGQIHRMRFIPPRRLLTRPSVVNPNSSCIRFEADKRSKSFARGVTEAEARALIDKMLLVYEFPRSWFKGLPLRKRLPSWVHRHSAVCRT